MDNSVQTNSTDDKDFGDSNTLYNTIKLRSLLKPSNFRNNAYSNVFTNQEVVRKSRRKKSPAKLKDPITLDNKNVKIRRDTEHDSKTSFEIEETNNNGDFIKKIKNYTAVEYKVLEDANQIHEEINESSNDNLVEVLPFKFICFISKSELFRFSRNPLNQEQIVI